MGQRFGRLVVTGPAGRDGRSSTKARWLCQCDCGKIINSRTDYLRSGRTTSCGCFRDGSRKGPGFSAWTQVYSKLRGLSNGAGRRRIDWDLTREQVIEIVSQRCHYCNAEPGQKRSIKSRPQEAALFNGLDRVDSSLGYTADNVVACCKTCNFAKNSMSVTEFKDWVRRIHAHFCSQSFDIRDPAMPASPPTR